MTTLAVVLVGRGRVGRALARALRDAPALDVALVAGRALDAPPARRALSRADVVWLTVPDSAVTPVATTLASLDLLRPRTVVLHAAGALSVDVLAPLLANRAALGALHPLVSFADARHAPPIAGSTFVAEGSPSALRVARALARACGARLLVARALDRALYHAAAALVANGAGALAAFAVALVDRAGIPPSPAAHHAFAGLLASVAHNVATLGPTGALTGPIVRGDVTSVRRHLARIDDAAPFAAHVYRDVGRAILDVARRRDLDPRAAEALAALLAPPRSDT